MLTQLRKRLSEPLTRVLRRTRAAVLSLGLPRRRDFTQPEAEVEASGNMSVIVAINDAPEMVERCLASLERYAPKGEIILVDDGSALQQTMQIVERFNTRNNWKVLRHQSPQGHSRCCEDGARMATRPYLCLLNSDTVVTPWSWNAMKEAFESDSTIGAAGPSTSWAATRQKIQRAMHCRHFWTDNQINGFADRYVRRHSQDSLVEVPEVGGFAFFIRKEVWHEVGGFDPNLPDYGNESELCLRMVKRGWRLVWAPGSYIHHMGRQSYGRGGDASLHSMWRAAREYIAAKHGWE